MAAAKKKAAAANEIVVDMIINTPDGKKTKSQHTIVNTNACLKASEVNNAAAISAFMKKGLINAVGVNFVK